MSEPVVDRILSTCLIVNYHSRTSSGAAAFTTEAEAEAYILKHRSDWQIGMLLQRAEYVSGRITLLLLRLINMYDVSVLCTVSAAAPGCQTVELALGDTLPRPEQLPAATPVQQGVPGTLLQLAIGNNTEQPFVIHAEACAEIPADKAAPQAPWVQFDAVAWLAQASAAQIIRLARAGYGGCGLTDSIAAYFSDGATKPVFAYVARWNVAFSCTVHAGDVLKWLQIHRPELVPDVQRAERERVACAKMAAEDALAAEAAADIELNTPLA